ncbi:hypothetical protein A7331_22555 [Pseudomonas aeruginosa]|nr:hypothetical protein AM599_22425 [Pseudomonas aeruginosa]AON20622.1 hypothetical protein A7331_22555 [Pseudomonas aeruginosa]AON38597.1 hypothetical protein A7329_22400 [Pseudomonas aeruginosa]AON44606.1 hypothetical protein A6701_22585 [Pseudomonas aeruginosa]ARN45540.1 hypothetical protein A6752_07300 [Pseudomonas aeruginosa]
MGGEFGSYRKSIDSAFLVASGVAVYAMEGTENKILLSFMSLPDSMNPLVLLLSGKFSSFDCSHKGSEVDPNQIVLIAESILCTSVCKSDKFMVVNFSNDGVCCRKIVPDISALI